MSILVTLCTYNEVDNLRELLPLLLALRPDLHVLVIDDNSPDGTGRFVDQMKLSEPRLHVLHRPGKLGLGTAMTAGFQYGIRQNYELLVNMDADFSHPDHTDPALIAACEHCDVAIASRYVPGGGVLGWSFGRKVMSRLINMWARMLLGLTCRDNSGSFRCYRMQLLRRIDWSKAIARGYAIPEEVLFRCRKAGARMQEVPFFFDDRRYGVTKINFRESLSAVLTILRLGLRRLLHRE
ncbi:MAG: polyprenol monophosphomannose synthase [Planctomyces sp.]